MVAHSSYHGQHGLAGEAVSNAILDMSSSIDSNGSCEDHPHKFLDGQAT